MRVQPHQSFGPKGVFTQLTTFARQLLLPLPDAILAGTNELDWQLSRPMDWFQPLRPFHAEP